MSTAAVLRNAGQRELYVCARCAFRATTLASKSQRRSIGQKYAQKMSVAEESWKNAAIKIKAGEQRSMLSLLEERGLIHQIAGTREQLDNQLTNKRLGAYVGIDPTAPSLHIGHLLPLMSLFWLYVHGYHTVTLLGGATSKIGDPTDRLLTRTEQNSSERAKNMVAMHYQLKKLWINVEKYAEKYGYEREWAWHRELVNNNMWLRKLTFMEVLQVLGHGLRMGTMLAKDTVKNKMEKGDGMSYAEFTYPVLQAWDWWHMYQTKGIQMQIGGSDQYGNITAGVDAIKYINTHHSDPEVRKGKEDSNVQPIGFTVPLLTTSSGQKFGKSAGNAIWLDKDMTNVIDLYNYFMIQSDADVGKMLKMFTFMPIQDIEQLVDEHMKAPHERKAQRKLASEFVELIHGVELLRYAEWQHSLLYPSNFKVPEPGSAAKSASKEGPLSAKDAYNRKAQAAHTNPSLPNAPSANVSLPRSLLTNQSIARIVFAAGLASSTSEAHRFVAAGSIYIGGAPAQMRAMNDSSLDFTQVKLWTPESTAKFLIHGNLLILRKGKSNVRIVQLVEDDEFVASGLQFPGYDHWSELRELKAMSGEGFRMRKGN